ncbi:hypothetical protein Tco_1108209 [Tanacetum coccineum]
MAESSNPQQTPLQQTSSSQQDQPESPGTPIAFDPAPQVDYSPDLINKPNNEVALIYPDHANKDHFKVVSDFISKCLLQEAFTRTPTKYKEYLVEFWYTAKVLDKTKKVWLSTPTWGNKGEVGVTSFRNAIDANYLAYSRNYDEPPTQEMVKHWFSTIRYGGPVESTRTLKKSFFPPRRHDSLLFENGVQIDFEKLIWDDILSKLKKKNREKVILYTRFLSLLLEHKMEGYGTYEVNYTPTQIFSVHNWTLKKNQPEGPPFTTHMMAICNAKDPVAFQAPRTSSYNK